MNPDSRYITILKPAAFLVALIFTARESGAWILSGSTRSGMVFQGQPVEIVEDVLHIDTAPGSGSSRMGIPLGNILEVHVSTSGGPLQLMGDLEGFSRILPYMDDSGTREILSGIRKLVSSRSWRTAYEWAKRLSDSRPTPDQIQFRAEILKARCLLEMGHLQPLADCLKQLNASQPAIAAPLELAWLNAHYHYLIEENEIAEFWAILPGIRIPVAQGPLMDDLNQIRHEINLLKSKGPGI